MILQSDESFDIRSNTGKLNKLTFKVERPELSPEDIKKLENAEAQALDGAPLHRVQGGPH